MLLSGFPSIALIARFSGNETMYTPLVPVTFEEYASHLLFGALVFLFLFVNFDCAEPRAVRQQRKRSVFLFAELLEPLAVQICELRDFQTVPARLVVGAASKRHGKFEEVHRAIALPELPRDARLPVHVCS